MMPDKSYTRAFWAAVFFHLLIACMLLMESTNTRPSLQQDNVNEAGAATSMDMAAKPAPETVKAVSVQSQEVMQTVNRLKQERANQIKAEQSRQQALAKEAAQARTERIVEQKHLAKLKDEAKKMAELRKKEIAEEQKHLEQLAKQKVEESERLEKLKKAEQALEKKQIEEANKLAEIKKKQAEQAERNNKIALAEKAKAQTQAQAQAKAEADTKAKADARAAAAAEAKTAAAAEAKAVAAAEAKAAAAAAAQALEDREARARAQAAEALQRAKMSGEVDKYKALIINAIGQRWILPEDVNRNLSSQFRIRLAPDGAVLEVSLMRSSGDPILDRSAEAAIHKASPLPVPSDPALFDIFREISLTVRPENIRG